MVHDADFIHPKRPSEARVSEHCKSREATLLIGQRQQALVNRVLQEYSRRRERPMQATRNGERMSQQVDPSHIMQVGMGFWASKTVLSAVELKLFTKLGSDGMTGSQIDEALELDT